MSKSKEWLDAWTGYTRALMPSVYADFRLRSVKVTRSFEDAVSARADAMMLEWEKRADDCSGSIDMPSTIVAKCHCCGALGPEEDMLIKCSPCLEREAE